MQRKNFLKIVFFNFLLLFIGIVLIETFFGSWFKKNNFSSLIVKKNITKVWKPSHYKSDHKAMYKKDSNGFRGDYGDIKHIKIITVGGSTTDERWIDEKLTWSNILQEKLSNHLNDKFFKVANAGVDGQSSKGHVKNFSLWFDKINNLKPKYVIFYLGINDAILLLVEIEKHPKFKKTFSIADNLVEEHSYDKVISYVKNNSALYNLYKIITGNIIARNYGLIHGTDTWESTYEKKDIELNTNNLQIKTFLSEYYSRLIQLKQYSKDQFQAEAIFITQRVPKNHYLETALSIINKQTKQFCVNENANCFKLDENLILEINVDLYDAFHTRPTGNKKISDYIFSEIIKKL